MSNYEELKQLLSASRKLIGGDKLNEDLTELLLTPTNPNYKTDIITLFGDTTEMLKPSPKF